MRLPKILAAAAPLALLAACGDNVEDIEAAAADTENAIATEDVDTSGDDDSEPAAATKLDEAKDASGTYTVTDADGTTRRITLDTSAGTYEYKNDKGETKTGSYTRADDGYRFIINDYNGRIGYFAFSNGDLVRLPVDATLSPDDKGEVEVSGERYRRDDKPFTREPELGSPVAPQDLNN
ncbi:MAG: hypothetical protein HKO05_05490 [Erythrobacter sp.]|nr:hypothetical protein [Erythrobacter sp.]RZV30055.1 MAG: hypothetical protein EX262_09660 [Sphingomonadaceae bacterium]